MEGTDQPLNSGDCPNCHLIYLQFMSLYHQICSTVKGYHQYQLCTIYVGELVTVN